MHPSSAARCWVEIDLGRLERNLKRIRAALPSRIRYVAVVKADAYGHGLAQTVSRLMRSGADAFAVANVREAAEICEIGSGWPIFILSAILPQEDSLLEAYPVIPAVSSEQEVQRFATVARRIGRQIPVHLKIDTGMGRAGVWHESAAALYNVICSEPNLRLEGVFTHFSSADSDAEVTRQQRDLFLSVLSGLPELNTGELLIHADNSAGLETFPVGGPFNGVRVGLLQFGIRPYADSLLSDVHAEPVMSFHSKVALVKQLPAGTCVSYNRTRQLTRPTRTAVIAAGYGDGIPTAMSNRGQVLIRGQHCPVLGRVTMDQIVVDVTDLDAVEPGDLATFFGSQANETISITDFCHWTGQIPWEAFTLITKRVQRIYKSDTAM